MTAILSDFLFTEFQPDNGIEVEVLGKKLIAHILDQFVGSPHQEVHLITANPSELRSIIGDGAYWSLDCRIHGVANAVQAWRITRSIAMTYKDELMHIAPLSALMTAPQHDTSWVGSLTQSGYAIAACLSGSTWLTLSRSANCHVLRTKLSDLAPPDMLKGGVAWSRWGERVLNQRALSHNPMNLVADRREISPGIFIEKGAIIHPSAKLQAPCHIGARCYVGAESSIGPMTSLGSDVIVSHHTTITHSLVRSSTVALEHNRFTHTMINPRAIKYPSGILNLDSYSSNNQLLASLGRINALLLSVLISPILVILGLALTAMNKPAFIRLAACQQQNEDRFLYYKLGKFNIKALDIFLSFSGLRSAPILWAIIAGNMRWFGSTPVSPATSANTTTAPFGKPGIINPSTLFGSQLTVHPSVHNASDLWWRAASHNKGILRQLRLAMVTYMQTHRS